MRPVIQSYKKVIDIPQTAQAAGVVQKVISTGVDSIAAGQTSATDPNVPTGSVIKYIEIQYSCINLTAVAHTHGWAIEKLHSGQGNVGPFVVGGSPIRNQVHRMGLMMMGANQNNNRTIKFKIPKKFQRVREGDSWVFITDANLVYTDAARFIYKFYR